MKLHMLCVLSVALLLVVVSLAPAIGQTGTQTIHLKDGSTLEAKIISEDDSTLVVETKYGRLDIWKSNVLSYEGATLRVQPDTARTTIARPSEFIVAPNKYNPPHDSAVVFPENVKAGIGQAAAGMKSNVDIPLPQSSPAQTIMVYMKDGSTFRGKVIAQDENTVVLETEYATLDLQRSDIAKMETKRFPASSSSMEVRTIRLKDGSMIKGVIRWEDSDTVEVQTPYAILKIPQTNIQPPSRRTTRPIERPVNVLSPSWSEQTDMVMVQSTRSQSAVVLFGGGSFPMGDYGSTTGSSAGGATTGFCAGIQFLTEASRNFEIEFSGLVNYNGEDEAELRRQLSSVASGVSVNAGHWLQIWALMGLGVGVDLSPTSRFYMTGLLGGVLGNTPDVSFTYQSVYGKVESASGTALGYGLNGGLIIERVNLGLRFLTTEPEYTMKGSGSNGVTTTVKAKQSTSTLQLTMGIVLN